MKQKDKGDVHIWTEILARFVCPECRVIAEKEHGETWPFRIEVGCYDKAGSYQEVKEASKEPKPRETVPDRIDDFHPESEKGKFLRDAVLMLIMADELPVIAIYRTLEKMFGSGSSHD
jgi:hypothetical protein